MPCVSDILFVLLLILACSSQVTSTKFITKYVSVNNSAVLYSYGYPDQLVTTYDTDTNPPNMDWNLTSSNRKNLMFFFDRLDLLESDMVMVCDQKAYAKCRNATENAGSCQCAFIQKTTSIDQYIEWDYYWGPPVLMYRPEFPSQETDTIYARNGYRVTVMEVDRVSVNRRFFQCNTTIDISEKSPPTFLISAGFPYMTTQFSLCQVKLISSSGIRIRVPLYSVYPNDTLSISGTSPNGGQSSWGPSDSLANSDTIETSYYLNSATVTIHMTQSKARVANQFVMFAEKYDVSPSVCDIDAAPYTDTSFLIQTVGNEERKNYINYLNCTYTVSNISPNRQLLLQIFYLNMESGADYLTVSGFKNKDPQYTGRISNLCIASPINITQSTVTIITDGLEARTGVNAYMNLLDCTCPGGTFTLSDGKTMNTTYPVPGDQFRIKNTYCKGVVCRWAYDISQHYLSTVLNFTRFDVNEEDDVLIYVDGMDAGSVQSPKSFTFFDSKTVEIVFSSYTTSFLGVETGFDFTIQSSSVVQEEINLCNSSLYYFNKPVETIRGLHFTSCKGSRITLVIMSDYQDKSIQVYDGSFENGTKMVLTDDPMIASGREMSIRISATTDMEEVYSLVISDSFTGPDGSLCGGTNSPILNPVEGCLLCYISEMARIQLRGPPCPVYRGFSVQEEDLIPTTSTVPLNLVTSAGLTILTFKIPKNYTGGQFVDYSYADSIDVTDGQVLVASGGFMRGECTDECRLKEKFVNYFPKKNSIQFQLLRPLEGDATVQINNDIYTQKQGLFNITVPIGSLLDFETPSLGINGSLLAIAYAVNSPSQKLDQKTDDRISTQNTVP